MKIKILMAAVFAAFTSLSATANAQDVSKWYLQEAAKCSKAHDAAIIGASDAQKAINYETYRDCIAKVANADSDRAAQKKVKLDKNGCLPIQKKRGVFIGMAESDIICSSWGKPTDISTMTTKNSVSKWYWYHNNGSSAIHITDGVIDSIHN